MSNGFSINTEELAERMTSATLLNDERGSATLYAVVCTNNGGESSHGGFVVATFAEALQVAAESNEASREGHACKYIPVALGMSYATFMATMGNIATTGDGPEDGLDA